MNNFNTIQKLTAVIKAILYYARHETNTYFFLWTWEACHRYFFTMAKVYPQYFERCHWETSGRIFSSELDKALSTLISTGVIITTSRANMFVIPTINDVPEELYSLPAIQEMGLSFKQEFYVGEI